MLPNEGQTPMLEPQWVDRAEGGVTIETAPRHMRFVRVSVGELEDLKSSNTTLELAFFGISFGALITIWATLKTVPIVDASSHATFMALAVLFGILSAYFGVSTVRGEIRWRRKIDALKRGSDLGPKDS